MTCSRTELFARLDALGIAHKTQNHAPVMTVEESRFLHETIDGVHTKNLFLRDEKGALFLVSAPHERRIDLKTLHKRIDCRRLSFGSADLLRQHLGVEPGSVTPLAAINDADGKVRIVLDRWMTEQPLVNCHPLENTATTTLAAADLVRFLGAVGRAPLILALDAPVVA
jgi:Ala-tRNA(Pro) deacylase